MKLKLKIPRNKTERLNHSIFLNVEKGCGWSGVYRDRFQVQPDSTVEVEIEDYYAEYFTSNLSDGPFVHCILEYSNSTKTRNCLMEIQPEIISL